MMSFIGFWIAKFVVEFLLFVLFMFLVFAVAFISGWRDETKRRKEQEKKATP